MEINQDKLAWMSQATWQSFVANDLNTDEAMIVLAATLNSTFYYIESQDSGETAVQVKERFTRMLDDMVAAAGKDPNVQVGTDA